VGEYVSLETRQPCVAGVAPDACVDHPARLRAVPVAQKALQLVWIRVARLHVGAEGHGVPEGHDGERVPVHDPHSGCGVVSRGRVGESHRGRGQDQQDREHPFHQCKPSISGQGSGKSTIRRSAALMHAA